MNILYLSHRIPYPPNKGDKIRSFNEVKFLSKTHNLHIATLCDVKQDLRYIDDLLGFSKTCYSSYIPSSKKFIALVSSLIKKRPISVNYFYSRKLQEKIDVLLSKDRIHMIFCFCSVMAEYIFRSKVISSKKKPLLIMDYCDLDSYKWYQYSKKSPFPISLIYRLEHRKLLEYEKKINREFDASIFVSNTEKEIFFKYYNKAQNVYVIPNGVDFDYFSKDKNRINNLPEEVKELIKDREVIIFVGAMDYKPNVDAVNWFVKNVYMQLKSKFNNICFLVVGANPVREIKKLHGRDGIYVTGFVQDVRPYYDSAHIVTVPIWIARGIQNKVLEAMAMEKCLVLTDMANEGIWAESKKHVFIANKDREFLHVFSYLLNNEKIREEVGKAARDFIMKNFSWENQLSSLIEIFP